MFLRTTVVSLLVAQREKNKNSPRDKIVPKNVCVILTSLVLTFSVS